MSGAGYLLLRAEADIILHGVIDTLAESKPGVRRFHQCCGIAMTRYIADPRKDKSVIIEHLYRRLQRKNRELPDIEMVLLPISHLRFGYLDPATEGLHDDILQIERELQKQKRKKGEEMKSASSTGARAEIIERYQLVYQGLKSEHGAKIGQLLDSRFNPYYPIGCAQRITQHDLAASGGKLRIPAEVMEMPLKSLTARLKHLLKAYPERLAMLMN